MSIKLKLGQRTPDPAGMTMRQLAQFITDAETAGIKWDERPQVQIGWRAQIKSIQVANTQEQEQGND